MIGLIACTGFGFSFEQRVWKRSGFGIAEEGIRVITIDSADSNNIYVGTARSLYQSRDGGVNYQISLNPSGQTKGVNAIYISDTPDRIIYACTDAGLYESNDEGVTWREVIYSVDPFARQCMDMAQYGQAIYMGTQKGLFWKGSSQGVWQKYRGGFTREVVDHLAQDGENLYVSTGHELFALSNKGKTIRLIFTAGLRQELDERGENFTGFVNSLIKFVEVVQTQKNYLFVSSPDGIHFSGDQGNHWESLPLNNLPLNDLTSILLVWESEGDRQNCSGDLWNCLDILVGTEKGVFSLTHGMWRPVYRGMDVTNVSYLSKNERGEVYAATAKGVYILQERKQTSFINRNGANPSIVDFNAEPSIGQVHQWAIDYAEVNNSKIKNWRSLSKKKALMPDLSVGLDRNASDLFHWNTGASPDELQKGRDYLDWDVSLSWDLADFIWSTDQTTIDSRSKLMVELREDILSQVTRLYFERRRIQMEMASGESSFGYNVVDGTIRIDELTALIDALTGGEFSRGFKK